MRVRVKARVKAKVRAQVRAKVRASVRARGRAQARREAGHRAQCIQPEAPLHGLSHGAEQRVHLAAHIGLQDGHLGLQTSHLGLQAEGGGGVTFSAVRRSALTAPTAVTVACHSSGGG